MNEMSYCESCRWSFGRANFCTRCGGAALDCRRKTPRPAKSKAHVITRDRAAPTDLHWCEGRQCPGLKWKASKRPHPTSCV